VRTALEENEFHVAPGSTFSVEVEVFNTSDVIDGVSAEIVGFDPQAVTSSPPELALFPQTTGTLRLDAKVPAGFPAGSHVMGIRIASAVPGGPVTHEDIHLEVAPSRAVTLDLHPDQIVARGKASFQLTVVNEGNVAQSLDLVANDPQGRLTFRFTTPHVDLPPARSAVIELEVRVKRRLLGGTVLLPFKVRAEPTDPPEVAPVEIPAVSDPNETDGALSQKPIIAPGIVTALLLASIIALWALAMLFGLKTVLNKDPLTKDVPASFYASAPRANTTGTAPGTTTAGSAAGSGSGSKSGGSGAAVPTVAVATPPGAIPKTGGAHGIGGSIKGVVYAASTEAGIGRIVVQAVHISPAKPAGVDANGQPTAATPTQETVAGAGASADDGSYVIDGLLPGDYKLHFTTDGYKDQWYPTASTVAGAQDVSVLALAETTVDKVTVKGENGSISGTVDTGISATGSTAAPPPVTVTVTRTNPPPSQAAADSTQPVATTTADANGAFTIPDLPAPADYQVTLESPSYQPSSVPVRLDAKQALVLNKIRMQAGVGSIVGQITDGTNPLGNVAVVATSSDLTFKTATPTVGAVGQFTLPSLPTPGTYLLTFTKDGFGTQTVVVALGPGENKTDVNVTMDNGTGTISGTVTDAGGNGLGNATVTVNGGTNAVVTQTLTSGGRTGFYTVSGLAAPGSYTVTVSAPDHLTETIGVTLAANSSATGQNVMLPGSVGTLQGTVSGSIVGSGGAPTPLADVTVSVTDGTKVFTATTVSSPAGTYVLPGLHEGVFAVTFSKPGYANTSMLITITAGQTTTQDATLPVSSGP
jgi:hypothetical protein